MGNNYARVYNKRHTIQAGRGVARKLSTILCNIFNNFMLDLVKSFFLQMSQLFQHTALVLLQLPGETPFSS